MPGLTLLSLQPGIDPVDHPALLRDPGSFASDGPPIAKWADAGHASIIKGIQNPQR
jgi:hypothetical protein